MLEAVALYAQSGKPVNLDVIGGGDYLEHYRQLADSLGLAGHVTFHGQQVGNGKYKPLKEANALICYPTTANDAFPTVVLEAWAHYTPVIAAKIGALPHIINDGQDGLLAASRDPAALAKVIGKMLDDENLQHKLALNGYKRAEALTWTKQAAKTDTLLQELIK